MQTERRKHNEIGGIQIRQAGIIFIVLAVVIIGFITHSVIRLTQVYRQFSDTTMTYAELETAAAAFEDAVVSQTADVRSFVSTGRRMYLDHYFQELHETRRQENALNLFLESGDPDSTALLKEAADLSQKLRETELYAMCVYVDSLGMERSDFHTDLEGIELLPEDNALSAAAKQRRAQDVIYSSAYETSHSEILEKLSECTYSVIQSSAEHRSSSANRLNSLIRLQTFLIALMIALLCAILYVGYFLVLLPQRRMVRRMADGETLPLEGVNELRYISATYNTIYEENRYIRSQLSYEASHDMLTGLYNRREFDRRRTQENYKTLILIDVDEFKKCNDTYGHETGDRVLKNVAEALKKSFRKEDIICRIGGDEFAVLMREADSGEKPMLEQRFKTIQEELRQEKDGLPPVTLSIGIALEDRETDTGDPYKDADAALYEVKQHGRNGYSFYHVHA